MTLMRRTSPFSDMRTLRQAMDHLFEDPFLRPRSFRSLGDDLALPLDIRSTPEALVVEAALPGVKPEAVEVTVTGDMLTISGSNEDRTEDEGAGYRYREIRRGAFRRSLTLASDLKADEATATFENGLLRLSIPRAESARTRRIPVAGATEPTETSGEDVVVSPEPVAVKAA